MRTAFARLDKFLEAKQEKHWEGSLEIFPVISHSRSFTPHNKNALTYTPVIPACQPVANGG
jgi:hypothetical protein